MSEKVIGLIPARMESTRFPGKAIYPINGYPMIYWVHNQAKKCELIDKLYVVTPNEEICEKCEEYDIPYILDKSKVSGGAQAIACVAENLDGDIYLNVQGDEPLLEPAALSQIIEEMITNKDEEYVGLYSLIKDEKEFRDRNVVKTVLDATGHAMYFSRSPIPERFEYGRALRVMGLYGYRPEMLKEFITAEKTELESLESGIEMIRMLEKGHRIKFVQTEYQSIGVDLPEHIKEVEKIMQKKFNR